jgi:hypothetical protein
VRRGPDLYIIGAGSVFRLGGVLLQYKRGLILSRVTSKSSKMKGRKSLSESYYFLKKKSQKITFLRVNRLRDISWSKGGYFVSEIVNFGKKRKLFSLFVVFDTFWTILYIIGAGRWQFVYNWCAGDQICI